MNFCTILNKIKTSTQTKQYIEGQGRANPADHKRTPDSMIHAYCSKVG